MKHYLRVTAISAVVTFTALMMWWTTKPREPCREGTIVAQLSKEESVARTIRCPKN